MKKLLALISLTLLLTACGGYTVATEEEVNNNPELADVIATWQTMVDAGTDGDCQTILDHMRKTLAVTEESCDAAIAYLKDAPVIDWDRTDANVDGGKVKIYQENGASVTGFILDTKNNVWGADTRFWEE
jgi:hypothetical protein